MVVVYGQTRKFVICVGQQCLFADLCFCSDSFLSALSQHGFVSPCPWAVVSCPCVFFLVPRLNTVLGARVLLFPLQYLGEERKLGRETAASP